MKPWLNKVEEYCKIEAMYSHNADKMMGVEPKNPTDLKFFEEVKSHLKSKYPNVLQAWDELKIVSSEYNKELATLLEEIRNLKI